MSTRAAGRPSSRPLVRALALAALGAALACFGEATAPDPGEELSRLVPGHRPVLGRTSLPLPHAPFDPATPAVGPDDREAIYARLLAAKVAGVPGAGAALAAFYAVRGETGDAARALAEATTPVDRGAVLIALDRADEALEELAGALALQPGDPAASFDRALALEALELEHRAALAWDAFLRVEAEGPWADEARERLARLLAPRPAEAATLGERKAQAVLRLYDPRPGPLEELRAVALDVAGSGDRFLLHAVAYLEGLDEDGWRRRAETAARFARLRADVLGGMDRSEPLAALAAGPEPFFGVKALHFAAYGAIVRGDERAGEKWLDALDARCRDLGCLEELALVASDRGTLRQREGDYAAALEAFASARAILPATFEARHAEIDAKRADVEYRSGAPERAIRLLDRAIRIDRRRAGLGLSRVVAYRGQAEHALGRTAAAIDCWAEAAAIAVDRGDASTELPAVTSLAGELARVGRRDEGLAILAETVARLRKTGLEPMLADGLAELARLQADDGALAEARRSGDEAVGVARRGKTVAVLANALESRARVARLEGDGDAALRWLREAVALDEGRAVATPGPFGGLGVRAGSASRRLLLALALGEAGDAAGAFAAFAGGAPAGLLPDECRVGFGRVEGRLLLVAASSGGAAFRSRAADRDATSGDDAPLELLLAPDVCPAGTRRISLLETPGSLPLPLAGSIRDRRPGWLVAVTHRPDARWPGPLHPARALVIHDPVLREPAEAALPGADREAAVVRVAFPDTVELRGTNASPAEVRARAPAADLVHFAVHGITRSGAGAASYLRLAGDPGRLQVADILELDLRSRGPLVVLSACRTAGVPERLEHDGAGLPWAFLRAGARAVLAGEGEVDDRLAPEFVRAFYAGLAAGRPVAEAAADAGEAVRGPGGPGRVPTFVLYF